MIEFKTEQELYNRLLPALTTKITECKRNRMDYISEADIWNYLKNEVWSKANNLGLSAMVHDIINADIDKIDRFIKQNLYQKREAELGE